MEEIMKQLDTVYQTISSIPVSGNAVDTMAVARAQLRKVYTELKKMNEEVDTNGD